tara:strand:- start:17054 stop:17842 length:789 start_codon:yes stop_codon:yes gene_type:complete
VKKFLKKSLGQNFLIDKNIIKKIIQLVKIENRDIIEIGPGEGALTDEILKNKPRSLLTIEKDNTLSKKLQIKYQKNKIIRNLNADILKFDLEKINVKNSIIFGNLPYNISSQILVKILRFNKWPPHYSDVIFMFQKELGDKIIGKFPSNNYGRISILTSFRLKCLSKFSISSNCFFPKPKVNSTIIHFQPKIKKHFVIKNIRSLEKITNVMFSNKRKMIKKNIKKLLNNDEIIKIKDFNLKLRPSQVKPEIYYKIAELYERS